MTSRRAFAQILPAALLARRSGIAAPKAAFAIVEKIASQVGFYTADGQRIAGVKTGPVPHEIILGPDRNLAYVSDNGILWMTETGAGGNTLTVVDVGRMSRAGVISLGDSRRPHGMDIDPRRGRLVVTTENPSGLLLLDLASRKVLRKFDTGGEAPHMVLLGPGAEYAYVSNTASATVGAVHLETGRVKTIPTDARPQGGVLSRDGRLAYITNTDGNSISIIDTGRRERVGTVATGKGPGRIALTPDGTTLVYNLQVEEAFGFADPASRRQTHKLPIGGRSLSLAMSPDGRFAYGGIQDQDKIVIASVPERKLVRTFQTPKNAGPDPVLPLP